MKIKVITGFFFIALKIQFFFFLTQFFFCYFVLEIFSNKSNTIQEGQRKNVFNKKPLGDVKNTIKEQNDLPSGGATSSSSTMKKNGDQLIKRDSNIKINKEIKDNNGEFEYFDEIDYCSSLNGTDCFRSPFILSSDVINRIGFKTHNREISPPVIPASPELSFIDRFEDELEIPDFDFLDLNYDDDNKENIYGFDNRNESHIIGMLTNFTNMSI